VVLGLVWTVIALSSDALWALTAGTLGAWLKRSRGYLAVRRWVTGTVFVALGASAARAA
jgi:threonine/homoserine/homoserine lactone efflux protein